jgi:hypothetical protein
VSAKSDNAEIAVLQTQMEEQTKILQETSQDVKDMKNTMTNWQQSFVSKAEFEEYKKNNWARHALSAIAGAVIVSLVGAVVYAFFHVPRL